MIESSLNDLKPKRIVMSAKVMGITTCKNQTGHPSADMSPISASF
jgi:hypothetical protein